MEGGYGTSFTSGIFSAVTAEKLNSLLAICCA
jgi:hypothetical protein